MPTLQERLRHVRDVYERTEDVEVKAQLEAGLEQLLSLRAENPLLFWEPHPARHGRQPQREFAEALTAVVAAQAGNQFGKSTMLCVCSLRECLVPELLPPLLRETKRYTGRVDGWLFCPTEDKIYDSFQPAFEEWCPPSGFKGGSWGKAFNGARMQLSFSGGSTIQFKTYKQDHSTLGGARLHFVGYDEPPPRKHREEARMRLVRYGGHEMFAFTPIDTNILYTWREIWKRREDPDITVVRGSIHDNPTLDRGTVERTIASYDPLQRQAREDGDFIQLGGLIYPDFERCVLPAPLTPADVHGLDVVIGIDPGIRNCGIVWVGFDGENVAHVFHEDLLQDATAREYAQRIQAVNRLWGIREPSFVIDPAAKQRAQANGMTVLAALNQEGVYPNLGQNDHELGFGQMRTRMARGRFKVSPACTGLRDEADEYASELPKEGQDDSHLKPLKGNDHRLDALRYAVLERFWDAAMEADAPQRNLGFDPTKAVDLNHLRPPAPEGHPMGAMF